MTAAKKPSATKFSDTRKIRKLTEELSREEYGLGLPLLDTAVAGVILGFKPSDREMRVQAQRCWEVLKPQLNQHLLSEDETVLPWAEGAGGLTPQVMNRIKNSHREMRALITKLVGVSFEEDPDKEVAAAGKALCVLAVKLDDLIDSEECACCQRSDGCCSRRFGLAPGCSRAAASGTRFSRKRGALISDEMLGKQWVHIF
jgi:hypothetical protein